MKLTTGLAAFTTYMPSGQEKDQVYSAPLRAHMGAKKTGSWFLD